MGMRTHINGLRILAEVETEPGSGWYNGIVIRPNGPFAGAGRQFIVFRYWDGKSDHWASGVYDLTLEEAMKLLGLSPYHVLFSMILNTEGEKV